MQWGIRLPRHGNALRISRWWAGKMGGRMGWSAVTVRLLLLNDLTNGSTS
jgi:hypothetical protein